MPAYEPEDVPELMDRLRELEADAARWQYVRRRLVIVDQDGFQKLVTHPGRHLPDSTPAAFTPTELDQAIDHARSQESL